PAGAAMVGQYTPIAGRASSRRRRIRGLPAGADGPAARRAGPAAGAGARGLRHGGLGRLHAARGGAGEGGALGKRWGRYVEEAPRRPVRLLEVVLVEVVHEDAVLGGRGVEHPPAAEVDADVALVAARSEEDEVPGAEVVAGDG